ncbi:MAG TPA: hypothetical protein VGM03_03240 [Phycisphaerae bacterium]|jgi:hypothetical protein
MMKRSAWVVCLCAALALAAEAPKTASTPESLKAQIEDLRVAQVAWRQIAWKSCLLEGLKESRATNKPLMLWVFIDRPSDDGRC